jgi:hypothetical protein
VVPAGMMKEKMPLATAVKPAVAIVTRAADKQRVASSSWRKAK